MNVRVREATFADYDAIRAVAQRNGLLGGPSAPALDAAGLAQARASFAARWLAFPERARFPSFPIGWVLEDESGACVGTLTNYPGLYLWHGEPLRAAIAGGWAVDPPFRGPTALLLMTRYLRQSGVELLVNSTASREAGAVLTALKCHRVPHPAYDETLLWITRYRAFAREAVRKLGVSFPLAAPGLAATLRLRDTFAGMPDRRRADGVEVLMGFDERFDAFWDETLRRHPERLHAVRTAAMLSWHFECYMKEGRIAILAEQAGSALAGYLVLVFERGSGGDLVARIADLQLHDERPAAVRRLLAAALALAREYHANRIEAIGFARAKRGALLGTRPLRRSLGSWLFYYRALREDLVLGLAAESAWDPCPYDGDGTL